MFLSFTILILFNSLLFHHALPPFFFFVSFANTLEYLVGYNYGDLSLACKLLTAQYVLTNCWSEASMRLIKKSAHPDGSIEVKVSVSTSEDLWHLYNFIIPGDEVRTKTRRKVVKESSTGTLGAEMKMIVMTIEVKQVAFDPEEVRIQGVNKSESSFVKLGAFHTLTITPFPAQDVTIIKKEWDAICEERLKDACSPAAKADTAAVLMNFGDAHVVLMTPSFVHVKATVTVAIAKKHKNDGTARDRSIKRFFHQTLDAVLAHVDFDKVKVLLICSPGHVREEFNAYIRQEAPKAEQGPLRTLYMNLSKVMLVKTTSNTVGCLREALSDPAVSLKMEATKCTSDIQVWQEFQNMMNNDPDRCVYTPQFVYHAALSGAIASLMISDAVFRSPDPTVRRFFLSLRQFVKKGGGRVFIFSSNHVTGEQLIQLGEVAAILHFACPEIEEIEVDPNFLNTSDVADFIRENCTTTVSAS